MVKMDSLFCIFPYHHSETTQTFWNLSCRIEDETILLYCYYYYYYTTNIIVRLQTEYYS